MAALAAWRLAAPLDRDLWLRRVITFRFPSTAKVGVRTRTDHDRAAFFNELLTKCMNLYGGVGTQADPLALARHPWTLTAKEFEKNFQAILGEELLKAADDDRGTWSATATLIGAAPTAAGIALAVWMPVAGAVFGVAGVGVVVAGAGSDVEKEHAAKREAAQIKAAFPQYAAIYRKEANYRAKFNGGSISS